MRQLMKQQKSALKYANKRSRIALFMEMRLGKSLVAIRWTEEANLKRILLIAPKSVRDSWVQELQKEKFADEEIFVLPGDTENRAKYIKHYKTKSGWFLTNPQTLLYCPEILKANWDCLIVDESTMIRNPKADITKILINKTKFIPYKAILTGCPAPECEKNYFEQFRFIYNGRWMHQNDYWWWLQRYYIKSDYTWVPKSGTVKAIQLEVAKDAFVMTAKEAGIGNKKIYEKRIIECNDKQIKLSKQVIKDFEFTNEEGKYVMSKYAIVNLGWLQQIAGGFTPEKEFISLNKIKEIYDLLKSDLKNQSVVIWFKYTHEIYNVHTYLKRKGINHAIFMGEEKVYEQEFKNGKVKVMLAQAKCGKFGLDWSIASTAFYYSNWWSNETRLQTEKRIEHPKKKHPLLYIDLLSEDSIDLDIFKALKMKCKDSNEFTEAVLSNWRRRNEL